jgi:hypothetical protein
MGFPAGRLPDLTLYTRDGCSLCNDALEAIDDVLAERGTAGLPVPVLRVVDIAADPALDGAYGDRIPVVAIGGEEIDEVIGRARLARLLSRILDGVAAA